MRDRGRHPVTAVSSFIGFKGLYTARDFDARDGTMPNW